ncbi:MAG: APC family permease [Planctomycetota bacterium]
MGDSLTRRLRTPGAVITGLGSILGTGVFVSIGIGAGIAGSAVVLAIALAACVAVFNGLSSAQLAAAHPVAGGTYVYAHRFFGPQSGPMGSHAIGNTLGFTAGWTFLIAKSLSAATAALGCAGYILHATGFGGAGRDGIVGLALIVVVALTGLVLSGLRRTTLINGSILFVTLVSLGVFVAFGLPRGSGEKTSIDLMPADGPTALLHATALMFVAYTGYGRIATMGEEVIEPRRTIPRAIIATLAVSALLYITVAFVSVRAVGAEQLALMTSRDAAPLELVARMFEVPGLGLLLAIGAVSAMLGVLLNLLLGLSRVLLATAREGDSPRALARLTAGNEPALAVAFMGLVIGGLVLLGDVRTTWTFSAFTVLVYYAITNAAALRLPREQRLYPRWLAWAGLVSCLGLAFFVPVRVWAIGLGIIGVGLVWRSAYRSLVGVWKRRKCDVS